MNEWIPLLGTGLAVRAEILDENQAFKNHGQSLALLAKRGGISPSEALAIANRRKWERKPEIEALKALALMMSNVELRGGPAVSSPERPA